MILKLKNSLPKKFSYDQLNLWAIKTPFGFIKFLRNQFLKTDGSPNEAVFVPVFRN
jgi:hypothetical protein